MTADNGTSVKCLSPLVPLAEAHPVMTVAEVAKALGVSRSTAYAALEGDLPVIQLNGRKVVPTAALRRLLQLDPQDAGSDLADFREAVMSLRERFELFRVAFDAQIALLEDLVCRVDEP